MDNKLQTSVQYLKGVGPKVAKILKKLAIETVEDLIYFPPRSYEDRTHIKPITQLQPSENEVVRGEVIDIDHQITRNHFSILKVIIADASGSIQAIWFNQPYLTRLLRRGMKLILAGKVQISDYDRSLQLQVKDFEIDTGQPLGIVPHYPLTEGLFPKKMRGIVQTALDGYLAAVEDYLPPEFITQQALLPLTEAITNLHFPKTMTQTVAAHRRLAFDDFFIFELGLALRKNKVEQSPGMAFQPQEKALQEFLARLPFSLTAAQKKVWQEIWQDMQKNISMQRLLQGDVGSGKTILAFMAALVVVKNGYQVAIMAPTEILIRQHYQKALEILAPLGISLGLLVGSLKKKEKEKIGVQQPEIIFGTHALIQESARFEKLGLVIIDEQHRFGVQQRARLSKKGMTPDVLVMTATPIPRSLALTLYGDLERSVIDALPPGRVPIKTHFVPEEKRKSACAFMREKIKQGQQVFVVYPLIEESEASDLKAAVEEAEVLQKNIFPEFKVGLLHGKMSSQQKDSIMQEFQANRLQVLVATTVIEVGIDIPNASIMVIEHAERFGLSQLHQLRGRIGRGREQAYCFLMGELKSVEARERVKAMLDSHDGFYIAEVDLRLRGPGDVYGWRQSGLPNFRVADIIADEKILREARELAFNLVKEDLKSARNIWESQRPKIKGANGGSALNG